MTGPIGLPFYRYESLRDQQRQRFVVLDVCLNDSISNDLFCLSDEPVDMPFALLRLDSGYQRNRPDVAATRCSPIVLSQNHHRSNNRFNHYNENFSAGTKLFESNETVNGLGCFADPRNCAYDVVNGLCMRFIGSANYGTH